MDDIFILGAARTPVGALNGILAGYTGPQLGAKAIAGALQRSGAAPEAVDEVIMGTVLSAGVGQAPARQAAIHAGLPAKTGATTVNKVCGSALKAVMLGAGSIRLGDSQLVVAGGMESMSKAPYLIEKARSGGYRLGHAQLTDSIIKDGLWDSFKDISMGICGEMCAEKHAISREAQDAWTLRSYERAQKASETVFKDEIVPVDGLAVDEEPTRAKLDKLGKLKPAFKPGGTITAANSSKINDGAAAVVLGSSAAAKALNGEPLARVAGWATHSHEPEWFTTAPGSAIQKLLAKVGWTKDQVDLYEVNEAFAVVTLAAIQIVGLDPEKVNVNGGSVAIGHPIGASGARILVTLLHAMKQRGAKKGVAAICLGGGEAVAVAVER